MDHSVVHLRLVDGTRVVAKYISENRSNILVENPTTLINQIQDDFVGVMLVKYNTFADTTGPMTFKKVHVISHEMVKPEFARLYYNSLEYSSMFAENETDHNMVEANQMLERAILETEMMDYFDNDGFTHEGTDTIQ